MSEKTYRNTLAQGYRLHWYEIQSVLGRGAYGITYLANDQNLDQQVAIKEYLPTEFASRESDDTVHPLTGELSEIYHWGLDRFLKEARTLAKFKHASIVRVLSVFEQNNTAYMVMEYERGEDLSKVYKKTKSFSEKELLSIYLPVLEGLQLVHTAGFIHRDIKPSNIYIRDDGSPVLIDFGSARQSAGTATRALTSLVTYGYAPFEQYNEGEEKQGPWTDIYALGACLYSAVCGKLPIDALTRGAGLLNKNKDPYEPASITAGNRFSKHFLTAIDRALMFRAHERPQSVEEWADLLRGETQAAPLPEQLHENVPDDDDDTTQIMQRDHPSLRHFSNTGPHTGSAKAPASAPSPLKQPTQPPDINFTVPPKEDADVISAESFRAEKTSFITPPSASSAPTADSGVVTIPSAQKPPPTTKPPGVKKSPLDVDTLIKWSQDNRPMALAALGGIAAVFIIILVIAFSGDEDIEDQVAQPTDSTTDAQADKPQQDTENTERLALITQTLQRAQMHMNTKQLISPVGANALENFQKVLQLDANNEAAQKGIGNIIERYVTDVQDLLDKDDLDGAMQRAKEITEALPNDERTANLISLVENSKNQSKELTKLLAKAQSALADNRRVKPENNSAVFYYRKVLALEESNQLALDGLASIEDYYAKQAQKYFSDKKYNLARLAINDLKRINPKSSVITQIEPSLTKLEKLDQQIRSLIANGDKAFSKGNIIPPKRDNALHYYQQALKLDESNMQARQGIIKIEDFFKDSFHKHIRAGQMDDAKKDVEIIEKISPGSAIARYVSGEYEKAKNTVSQKSDIDVISELIGQYKSAFENKDFKVLTTISEFQDGRKDFVSQFFAQYQSFKLDVSGFRYIGSEHKGLANISIKELVNKSGSTVQPASWSEFEIVVRKNLNNQWKVHW